MPLAFVNTETNAALSSSSTPMKMTPRDAYFLAAAMRSGVSARHGGHQVAKKFMTTIRPRVCASDHAFESNDCKENAGAGMPSCGALAARAACAPAPIAIIAALRTAARNDLRIRASL